MSQHQVIANRYEILATIGQGGMGDVFRGRDRQTGETVAIKLLKPDILDLMPTLIERFTREGEILRQLDHPNIVKMLDTVEEDGMHYLVMEYVGGGSLQDVLDRQGQLPIQRVLEIALDLADALTRAHRLKVIHRDIKPANVLLAEDGTPRLTDFGVALMTNRTRMTETGSLVGTYAYLSPEACRGEVEVDARTDIWALGVMLFEMLAGQRPFDGENAMALLFAVLHNPIPKLAELRPDVPPGLVSLIERMLEKDRDRRIPSVRQVGAELEALMQGLEAPLRPLGVEAEGDRSRFATPTPALTPTQAAAPAPARRWDVWALIGGVLGLVAVVAVVLGLVLAGGSDKEEGTDSSLALVEPVEAGQQMVLVAQLEPLQGVAERDVTRFIVDDLRETLENEVPFSTIRIREYAQVITSDEQAQAVAEANGATVIVWGNYTPDFVELKVQVGVTASYRYIRVDRDMLERTANLRLHLVDERRESAAIAVLHVLNVLVTADGNGYGVVRILAIMDEIDTVTPPPANRAVASYLYQGAPLFLSETVQAVELYNAAVDLDPANPIPYAYRSTGYLRMGEYEASLRDIETAQRLGPPEWATPFYQIGTYQYMIGDYEAAWQSYSRAAQLRPDDWFVYSTLGGLAYFAGDWSAARTNLTRAVELGSDANFPYVFLAMLALRGGHISEMQGYFEVILTQFPDPTFGNRITEALMGSSVPNIYRLLLSAAGNLMLGQYDQVIADTEAALALNIPLVDIYLLQGLAYCNLNDLDHALAAYDEAIALDPDFVAIYLMRGDVYRKQGSLAQAMIDLRAAREGELGAEFDALIDAGMSGELDCTNFLTYRLPASGDATDEP